MTELDDMLRQSFARNAEPGDPTGVVDAIRARMAAGDTGTPAATSGFRSSSDRLLPWLFGGAVVLFGGAAIVLTVLLSGTATTPAPAGATEAVASATPSATETPTTSPTPTATPVPTPVATEEAPPPPVVPVADTTAPTIGGASASPDEVFAADSDSPDCDITSTISAVASDNVGVASVAISWTGAESGSGQMSIGANWSFVFNPAQGTPNGTVTFSMVARDAAGNTSAPVTTSVTVWSAGNCLI